MKAERAELAGHSDRRVLQAALQAGVLVGDGRHPGRWSQLVKIAGKARRVVVIPAEIVFPSLAGGGTGVPAAGADDEQIGEVDVEVAASGDEMPAAAAQTGAADDERRPAVPGWVMERAGRLAADSRVELFERLEAGGFGGRRLGHDELVTVERWLVAAERSSSRVAPTGPRPDVRPTRRPASAPVGAGVSRVPLCGHRRPGSGGG